MKLYYNNVDIYNDVSVNYCVYESYAEKQADMLTLRLNDVTGMWSGWNPQFEDMIRLQYDTADTGTLFVNSINAENGIFTIRAVSLPPGIKGKKSRSWENISFLRLISQIASDNSLSYKCYGIVDQKYKYICQENETDLAFLERLATYESCSFMIYNKTLVVYSEPYMESRDAQTLTIGENGVFSYEMSGEIYGGCSVSNGGIAGSFRIADGPALRVNGVKAMSDGEAVRFAKGILRKHNKNSLQGRLSKSLRTQYSAASVVNLETAKASMWNRKVFLTHVRHDFLKNQSDLYFRGVLEGY